MADEPCFFLVQWEDRFMSVIEPKTVVAPKTDVANYKEGDLIKATYLKRTYDAVISEIHHDRLFLLRQAKLPPKHAFQATKDREKTKEPRDHTPTEPRDKPPVQRSLILSDASKEIDHMDNAAKQKPTKPRDHTPTEPRDKPPVQRSLILSDASKEIDHMDNAAKQKPTKPRDHTPTEPRDKPPVQRSLILSDASKEIDHMDNAAKQKPTKPRDHTPTEPRDKPPVQRSLILSDASKEIDHLDNAAKQKPSSEKPVDKSADVSVSDQQTNASTSHIQSSKKRSVEKRLDYLEREVKELRRALKKARTENEEPSASSTIVSCTEKGVNGILEAVNHLSPGTNEKDVNECLKKLCFAVFSKEEMVNCSRTGKKTVRSPGAQARPALDKQKMEILEKAVLTKCPSLHMDVLKKKIDNIIKMTRRDATKEKL